MSAFSDIEIWFVAGSVDLYGDDQLAQVESNARVIAAQLDGSPHIPIRIKCFPVMTTREAVRKFCLQANSDEACAGVIAWMHTFSPAKMWIPGLSALREPLLHLHTQFERELPWSSIDMDYMNLHQSAHGDREFAHIGSRLALRRKTIHGHWRDTETLSRIGGWARAAAGLYEARRLKVTRFGDNMRNVAVTEGDKVEAEIRLGFSVDGYGVADLVTAVGDVSDEAVKGLVSTYESEYELASNVRAGGDKRDSLFVAARIELGLREFLADKGSRAFTTTFEDLGGLRQLPGISAQRLMADGYGFAAEGDWKTAALVRITKVMASGLAGGTSFMEDYTYHFDGRGSRVLGAHMLEICPSIASKTPTCEVHYLGHGAREDPVRLVFTASAGPGLVATLVDLGHRFRFVVNDIDVVAPDLSLDRLPVASATWIPRPDLVTAAEAWLMAGGAHHTVLTQALPRDVFSDFVEMTGSELLIIDETTNVRAFSNELRWNYAYFHLAEDRR